jgi:hypothetical protein
MWRDGALNGRCLFLSSGFIEYRHFTKIGKIRANKDKPLKGTETVPYYKGKNGIVQHSWLTKKGNLRTITHITVLTN